MLIDGFLIAFENWQHVKALVTQAKEGSIEHSNPNLELAEKMERQAAQQVETALKNFVNDMGAVHGSFTVSETAIYGSEPRTAYPPIGNAPIPVCTCTHRRDQHLKARYACEVLDCQCVEFVKNLAPNMTQR
jgi:hypothetical protein